MKRPTFAQLIGTGLMTAGIVILVGMGALLGYAQFEQEALTKQIANGSPLVVQPRVTPGTSDTASAVPATAPAISHAAPILRITASSIGLDARVAESPLVGGQWIIPKFEAGHLQGTAQPLTGGNVVLAGHVESISSGDVFANIDELKPGDTIDVYTRNGAVSYVVRKVHLVSNTDLSVLRPGKHETLTLITCSGSWLPLQHDYSQRVVVVAERQIE